MSTRPPLRLFADTEWLHDPPAPQLIEGLWPGGALGMVYGSPGTGKTFVTISLATAVGLAADWLGHRIADSGPVVYCVGEGHAAFPLRLQAVRTAHGLRDDEPSGVFYVREPLSLLRVDDVTWLLDSIAERLQAEQPRALIFDPLTAFLAGGDENSTADMTAVVAALNRIRSVRGAAIILSHHVGWNAERERGSTVLRGAMDVMYAVKADDGFITLECAKLRDGAPPPPLNLRLVPRGESCVVEAVVAGDRADLTRLTLKQQQALDALRNLCVDDDPVPYSRWKTASRLADSTFDDAVPALIRAGQVTKSGRGRNARYLPTHPGPRTYPGITPAGVAVSNPGTPRGSLDPGARGNGAGSGIQVEQDEPPF